MKDMKIIAGLDIGNGYVKAKVDADGETFIMDSPSVVSYTVGSDIPKSASDEYLGDMMNQLDATITTRALKPMDAGRVFFGTRAIRSGESLREFDISNHEPKCQDALSTMLVLGSLASAALRAYWNKNKELPKSELNVSVVCGLALPIEDFMDWKDSYRNTLMSVDHSVIVHNFERDITVKISIADVEVLAEGAAAQYAIANLGVDFLQLALDAAREQGAHIDAAYTGEILAAAQNTIGIDVGEGTTNIPVFADGAVSVEASRSINKGYGTVLTSVVTQLRNSTTSFESRKDLADFMLKQDVMPAQSAVQAKVSHYIDEQVKIFARDVLKEFTNVWRKVGMRTDVVYIYGGGAGAVKDILYPMVISAVTLDDGNCVPVIYLDAQYSRNLNRTGLFEVAKLGAQAVNF